MEIYTGLLLLSYFIRAGLAFTSYKDVIPEHRKCLYGHENTGSGSVVRCHQFRSPPDCSKGFYCKGGPYDSEGSCCLINNPCYHGKPIAVNRNALGCHEQKGTSCPKGHYCHIDKDKKYAVCCPDIPMNQKCEYGRLMVGGKAVICEKGSHIQTCLSNFVCQSQKGNYGGCCAHSNPCKKGKPYQNKRHAVFCAKGNGGQNCPEGFYCKSEMFDQQYEHAVCCPDFDTGDKEQSSVVNKSEKKNIYGGFYL